MTNVDFRGRGQPDNGSADVVYVLLLLQGAFALLAAAGMVVVGVATGALAVLAIPMLIAIGKPVLLFVLAGGVGRRRPWARKMTVAVEALSLLGFVVNWLIGLLPMVDQGLNPVTLITGACIPVGVIVLLMHPRLSAAWSRPVPARAPTADVQRAA
jgi:hypothetical protein